jgi:hypothetical protein
MTGHWSAKGTGISPRLPWLRALDSATLVDTSGPLTAETVPAGTLVPRGPDLWPWPAHGGDDRVFVGTNSTLVASVRLGHGAYVDAGSFADHDVPAGAIAVGRTRQRNIEGWAARRQVWP